MAGIVCLFSTREIWQRRSPVLRSMSPCDICLLSRIAFSPHHDHIALPVAVNETAFNELWSHGMFRDAMTGKRNGSICHQFDIGLLRHDRAKPAAAVQKEIPLSVRLDQRQTDRNTTLRQARAIAAQRRPDIFAGAPDGKSSAAQKLVDSILREMVRAETLERGVS